MKHRLSPIPSGKFTYDEKTKVFTAEASDLSGINLFSPIYDDACDAGFAMESARTGQTVTYCLEKEHRNNDNDVTHWTFTPITESIRKTPICKGTSVMIFND